MSCTEKFKGTLGEYGAEYRYCSHTALPESLFAQLVTCPNV